MKNLGGALAQVMLGPGERIDTLVDFSGLAAGTEIMLQNKQFGGGGDYQGTNGFDILKFVVTTVETETYTLPDDLSDIVTLTDGDVTGETRTFDVSNANISSLRWNRRTIHRSSHHRRRRVARHVSHECD